MKRILTLIVVLLSAAAIAQTNYYVDGTSGNNSNNGLTLATAWKTIQKACNSAVAGSVVNIKGGTYHENVVLHSSGTAENPIVYTNYQNDVVVLDGSGTTGTVLIDIAGKSYVTFQNMTLQNLTSAYAKGVSVSSGSAATIGITLRNLTIRNIGWTMNAAEIPGESDNSWAIYVRGQSGGISNLMIDDCGVHDNVLGYSEAITIGGNVDGFTIKNTTVYDNTNIGIHCSGNSDSTEGPRNGLISGNTCYGNLSPIALSAGIYIDGSHDITVERNSTYGNGIGIEVGCELDGSAQYIKVKNNLIYSNRNTGLAVGGYTNDTTGQVLYSTFRNNTFFQNNTLNSGVGEITVTKASNCVFEDNLVYANSQNVLMALLDIDPQENNLFNYNCWYTPSGNANNIVVYQGLATYSTFSAYKNGSSFDSNSMFANPGMIASLLPDAAGMFLVETSTCIDSGNPELITSDGETDFDGNPRITGSAVDIGAREFNSSLAVAYPEFHAENTQVVPNPFRESTFIISATLLDGASVVLSDFTGKTIRKISGISGNRVEIKRDGLPAGFYFYRITKGEKVVSAGKIIAQ